MSIIRAAVIGHPVAQSLSPRIHNAWIKQYGLDGFYTVEDISPQNLKSGIESLVAQGLSGFNVTIPHKVAVMELCATLDASARAVGAVNTVVIKDVALHGYNTDAFGFVENIKEAIPDFDFAAQSALVLGAGGAARAAIYGLLQAGVRSIYAANRSAAKLEDIKRDFPFVFCGSWDERESKLQQTTLLVNTTSLGMAGQKPLEMNLDNLPQHAVVYDIVYKPLMTDLLQQAQQRGNKIVTGIGMLLHQARPAFQHWFGVLPEVTPELLHSITEAAR